MTLTGQQVANVGTLLDFGAIIGSIILGLMSDLLKGKRSFVAFGAIISSCVVGIIISEEA